MTCRMRFIETPTRTQLPPLPPATLLTYGPDDKFYNLQNVPFAVNHPHAIFKGLEREGHETSYCYVAKPVRRFINDTLSEPLRAGLVFVVFVSSNLEIFNWRFEKACGDGKFPENHHARFTKLIWENNP